MSGRKPALVKIEGMRILAMTLEERRKAGLPDTMQGLADLMEVHPSIPYVWQKELDSFREDRGLDDKTIKKAQERIRKRTIEQELKEIEARLIDQAKNGNISASRLLFEKHGLLIKKEEITHKIDGGDIARAILQAEHELGKRDEGEGMGQVPKKPLLLPDPLYLSSGQGEAGESPIPDVDSPSKVN